MSVISTMFHLINKPHTLLPPIMDRGLLNWLPDKPYICLRYYGMTGDKLNLSSPKGFNEKLQYLKLNNRKPEYSEYVDKYRVRGYVERTIGSEYLVPLYCVWEKPQDINFDSLPMQFVLKCNHDSGSIKVIDKHQNYNMEEIKNYYGSRLRRSSFAYGREWPYKNVTPCIIAEAYLEDNSGELRDYKFFCFNGHVHFFKIDFDRFGHHRANYYSRDYKFMPVSEMLVPNDPKTKLEIPREIGEMIDLAEKLAYSIPFVRVDFYNVNGKIYFGEMTFFPGSGFDPFLPSEWEYKIGDMLNLS